ncbi:DUF2550 domain-containing protein [Sesbania bispinosa]|nr:DUF2550 domain-containing protein [Sesbania bispinosa]
MPGGGGLNELKSGTFFFVLFNGAFPVHDLDIGAPGRRYETSDSPTITERSTSEAMTPPSFTVLW